MTPPPPATATTATPTLITPMTIAPPSPPPPYFMCSQQECEERQSSGEISIFESQWPPLTPSSATGRGNSNSSATTTTTTTAAKSKKPSSLQSALQTNTKIQKSENATTRSTLQQQQHERQTRSNTQQPSLHHHVVSPSPSPSKQPKSRRMVNPQFAMTKFRRSAAGTTHQKQPRSLTQLESCMDLLEFILCFQQQPPTRSSQQQQQQEEFPRQALTGTVSFVEDRIRAMQVDMVIAQQPSASLQYRMVQCHILILYLLGTTATYEVTFGQQALSTALTNYWEERHYLSATTTSSSTTSSSMRSMDDDILCWMALHQLCQYYQQQQQPKDSASTGETTSESLLSFILDYYRRNVTKYNSFSETSCLNQYPKFQWVLNTLISHAVMKRPRSVLRQLVELQNNPTMIHDCAGNNNNNNTIESTVAFAMLCRCCMAPVIDHLRMDALEQYNTSFGKGEKVTVQEVARLLYFADPQQAGDFAATMAGLTRQNNSNSDDAIVFKVGPIIRNKDNTVHHDHHHFRQDEFVFGKYYNRKSWNTHNLHPPRATAWDDEPHVVGASSSMESHDDDAATRIDSEGVLIPPPMLLYQILKGFQSMTPTR